MANNAGTYLQFARINWLRTAAAYPTPPTNTYLALWTATPYANGTGGTEVSAGGYARTAIASSGWSATSGASPTQISNSAAVTFPTATADWGTITAISLMSASTAGNMYELIAISPTRAVYNGDTLTFAIGNIPISENGISTYLQAARLNWFKGTTYATAPSNVYVSLFSTAPALDGTGGTEISGGGYARATVAQGSASWNAQAGGGISGTAEYITNNAAITFPTATADWGTVVAAGIYDAATSGNLLYLCNLAVNRTVLNGDTFTFASGNLQINED